MCGCFFHKASTAWGRAMPPCRQPVPSVSSAQQRRLQTRTMYSTVTRKNRASSGDLNTAFLFGQCSFSWKFSYWFRLIQEDTTGYVGILGDIHDILGIKHVRYTLWKLLYSYGKSHSSTLFRAMLNYRRETNPNSTCWGNRKLGLILDRRVPLPTHCWNLTTSIPFPRRNSGFFACFFVSARF